MKIINLVFVLVITFLILSAQWMGKAELPRDVGAGGGITWGRGYVFAVVGDNRDYFYVYFPEEDSWKPLPRLPNSIYQAGSIKYAKSSFNFEKIFVAAQIRNSGDRLFIYSFSTGPYGTWDTVISLSEEVGPGVSLTFRPLGYIAGYVYPIGYEVVHGDLYLAIGNSTNRFYSLRFRGLYPIINPAPLSDYVFPPDDTLLEAQEIFFIL